MSQFLIGQGAKIELASPLRFQPLTEAQRTVQEAAADLLGGHPGDGWLLVDDTGDTTDQLFSAAMADPCELLLLLNRLCLAGCKLFLWYSNDWFELPVFTVRSAFIAHVEAELARGAGEVYAVFEPRSGAGGEQERAFEDGLGKERSEGYHDSSEGGGQRHREVRLATDLRCTRPPASRSKGQSRDQPLPSSNLGPLSVPRRNLARHPATTP